MSEELSAELSMEVSGETKKSLADLSNRLGNLSDGLREVAKVASSVAKEAEGVDRKVSLMGTAAKKAVAENKALAVSLDTVAKSQKQLGILGVSATKGNDKPDGTENVFLREKLTLLKRELEAKNKIRQLEASRPPLQTGTGAGSAEAVAGRMANLIADLGEEEQVQHNKRMARFKSELSARAMIIHSINKQRRATLEQIAPGFTAAAPNANIARMFATPERREAIETMARQVAREKELTAAYQAEERAAYRLSNARYQLYDVSSNLVVTSGALLAANIAVVKAASDYESALAAIRRTSESTVEQTAAMRTQFAQLASTMATPFADIAKIGELAGQLNIPTASITDFTRTTAQFAATTNVTAEGAAEAFGRINSLVDGVDNDFNAMGSAILAVGINSVATEQDIVNMSTSIAAVTGQAGFAADEVIGFAGAMASMGIKAELGRGALTRVFGVVSSAIAEGGAALDEFARVNNQTSEEFASAWRADTAATFTDLLENLGATADAGEDLYQVFNRLGVTNSRDIDVLSRMAQNHDILAAALQESTDAYAEGTSLQEAYAIQASTLAGRLTQLGNSVQAMFAEIGSSSTSVLGPLVSGFATLANVIRRTFADNAVLGVVAGLVGGLTGLLAVGGLVVGGLGFMAGGLLAARGAMTTFKAEAHKVTVALREKARLAYLAAQADAVSGAAAGTAAAAYRAQGAAIGTGLIPTMGRLRGAVAGMRSVGGSMVSALGGPWVLALTAAAVAATTLSTAIESSQASVQEWTDVVNRGTDAAELFALANEGWDGLYNDADFDFAAFRGDFSDFLLMAEQYDDVAAGMGQIEFEGIPPEVMQTYGQFMSAIGQIDSNLAEIAATGAEGAASASAAYFQFTEDLGYTNDETMTLLENFDGLREALIEAGQAAGEFNAAQEPTDAQLVNYMQELQRASADSADSLYYAADASDVLEDSMGTTASRAQELGAILDQEFSNADVFSGFASSLDELISGIITGGTSFDYLNATGQANLSNLSSAIAASIAAGELMGASSAESVNLVFQALQAAGVETAQVLAGLSAMGQTSIGGISFSDINASAGSAAISANTLLWQEYQQISSQAASAAKSTGGFSRATDRAGRSAGTAAKEVRTLKDYASDLSTVMSRAFEIRFGASQGMDSVTEGWSDIADRIAEARVELADARREFQETQATIRGLTADRSIQEYFLSVAEAYGDSLRADKLRADIATTNSKIAEETDNARKAQEKAAEAQENMSTKLTGNSKSAIENRSAILGLVTNYQDYIDSLAASGADQATLQATSARLKQEFIRQATQLGYNRREIDLYAAAFDDAALAIQRVPRNITVTANINPAIQALNELVARAARSGSSAGSNFGGAFGGGAASGINAARPSMEQAFNNVFNRIRNNVVNTLTEAMRTAGALGANGYKVGFNSAGLALNQADGRNMRVPQFKHGGYTGGNIGRSDFAGEVHGQEFVINADNTGRLGLPFLNALNNGATPAVHVPTFAQNSIQVVELSAYDRQLLANAGNVKLQIGNKVVAGATSASNINAANRGSN